MAPGAPADVAPEFDRVLSVPLKDQKQPALRQINEGVIENASELVGAYCCRRKRQS